MASKITYWKLTTPKSFGSKPALLDAVQILDNEVKIGTGKVTISYVEGWTVPDELGVITSIFVPPGTGVKIYEWTGADYVAEKKKLLSVVGVTNPAVDFEAYLMSLFYAKLGASKPEYAGSLVVQDA